MLPSISAAKTTALCASACCLLVGLATAGPTPAAADSDAPPAYDMATVTVSAEPEDLLSGSSQLSAEVLSQLPFKNGSIAEAITVLPRVQAGEEQRTSERAGEILPPLISISGARPYESLYSVDGVALNSLLDPLANNPSAIDSVPGHPQRTFLQRDLIDSVTVYDSNIPARYGRFLGGVIDARTRMPAPTFGGSLSYRTTRDAWARQHIDATREAAFDNSTDHTRQPDYRKFAGGLTLDIPLSPSSGLLAAYSTVRSEIDLTHLGESRDQDRTIDNYLLKYVWTPPTAWTVELTGSYTPSEEIYFLRNTRDSDLEVDRGGYALNTLLTGRLAAGELLLSAAYVASENSRTAPGNYLSWQNYGSTTWGAPFNVKSQEGGFGDLDTAEESLQFKADLLLKPVRAGAFNHALSLGVAYTRDEGSYERKANAYVYNTSVIKPAAAELPWLSCAPDDIACRDDEQYFSFRNVYAAERSSAVVHHQAYYVEDLISFGRFTLRPGLRLSTDDYLDNRNLAHRLTGSWDLFGTGGTRLTAGHNRYYGEALLTYSLREAITPFIRERRTRDPVTTTLSPWTTSSVSTATLNKFSELDTPYSDEFAVGIAQQLFGGTLSVDYVDRRHRRQFARSRVTEVVNGRNQNFWIPNNNGSSDYESASIGWERQWRKHYLNVNYTYAESTSSNESYDTTLEDAQLDTQVWYDGRYIDAEQLPRTNYYRPHVVNVVYSGKLPWGFAFTNVTKFQSGYQGLETLTIAEKIERGIPASVTAYERERQPDYLVFDWRIDWEGTVWRNQRVMVSLEANNVFDRKIKAGGKEDIYELGREFWLGVSYRF
jgi:hypothetical protein